MMGFIMKNLDVVVPTFHSKDFIEIFIRSFEKFKPETLDVRYIVVENSTDSSYRNLTLGLAEKVLWIENPTHLINSEANAEGVDIGLQFVSSEYVFIAHCDTVVTNSKFFLDMFSAVSDGFKLVGTVLDPARIKAVHISGLLVETNLAKSVSYYPVYDSNGEMTHDTGDLLTQKCRDEDIMHTWFANTFNLPDMIDILDEPFKSFTVDRCLSYDNEVMFMHLGRGIPKMAGIYNKPNRVYFDGWVEFCKNYVLSE